MTKQIVLSTLLIVLSFTVNAQNIYLLNNNFKNEKFDKLYKQNDDGTYSPTIRTIAKSLKGYVSSQSDDKDTLFINFWNIINRSDNYKDDTHIINSTDNGSTFAYIINWENYRYFTVPFSAITLTATSIPFRYRLKSNSDLEAQFLNVGVNMFFVNGKTKFFKQEQIDARQNYFGWGPFIAFSQQKIDSSNTNGKVNIEQEVAAISYGISAIKSWNGFSIIIALGCDNAIGHNAQYWEENNFKNGFKPWIGFGFGFKLTDMSFKSTNSSQAN